MNNGCIMQNLNRNCKIILIWKNFWMSDVALGWSSAPPTTGQSDTSRLVIPTCLPWSQIKHDFYSCLGEKKLSSFISTLQFIFLDQTRQVCKFVELAFKTSIIFSRGIFNSWTTKCTQCLTLERFLQTVAKPVKPTHTLVLSLCCITRAPSCLRLVSGLLSNFDEEMNVRVWGKCAQSDHLFMAGSINWFFWPLRGSRINPILTYYLINVFTKLFYPAEREQHDWSLASTDFTWYSLLVMVPITFITFS